LRGRKLSYTKEHNEKALDYIERYADYGDVVPSEAGLAVHLGVDRKTVRRWAERSTQFRHTLDKLNTKQHQVTLNGGLSGQFNASITKLLLHNHGYSDKQALEHTGSDGGPVEFTLDMGGARGNEE